MLSLLQFVAAGYARLTGHGRNIEDIAERGDIRPPETPSGYAFSIWFVIFALSVAYGLYYASKGQQNGWAQRLSWPAAILFAFSSAWMFSAQIIGDGWHLVFLIVIMWAASVRGLMTLRLSADDSSPRFCRFVLQPLFGLFTGWLTAAMFLNITTTFSKSVGTLGLTPNSYALLTLIPAGIVALALIRRLRAEPWMFAAILWAITAIIVANLIPESNKPIVAVCGGLAAVLTAVFAVTRAQKVAKP
jgi:hypothetical protein